jgi:hypothetical protein
MLLSSKTGEQGTNLFALNIIYLKMMEYKNSNCFSQNKGNTTLSIQCLGVLVKTNLRRMKNLPFPNNVRH